MSRSGSGRCLFSEKVTFQIIFGQNVKIQWPKKPETRTKVDFLFERANIFSRKLDRTICSAIKKKITF